MAAATVTINYNAANIEKTEVDRDLEATQLRFLDGMAEGLRKRRIEEEKKIILLWVLSQHAAVKGYEYEGRLEWLFQNRDLLLKPQKGHNCAKHECTQFNAIPQEMLCNRITGEIVQASGDVFICSLTGMAHECPASAACPYTIIDPTHYRDGFYCPVTARAKQAKKTAVEGYSAERPISKDRFDKQVADEDNALNDKPGDEDEGPGSCDLEEDVSDDERHELSEDDEEEKVVEMTHGAVRVVDESMSDNHVSYVQRLFIKAEKKALKDSSPAVKRLFDKAYKMPLADSALSGPPSSVKRKQPPKRTRLVKTISEMTPEERSSMHLKDLDKKQLLAVAIVKFALSFENQARLYGARLEEQGVKACRHVNSQKRKAKRSLTTIECDNMFLAFMTANLPVRPRVVENLYFGRYVNAIMYMWLVVCQSPYARGVIMPKQKPLKFEKMAFGLMYRFAGGGYKINCSLPDVVLHRFELQSECPDLHAVVSNFQVGVITHDPAVCAAIVDSAHLLELHRHSLTHAQPDARTVNEGYKLLENCYKSIFKKLAQDCIRRLQKGEDKRLSVQAYIDACISKKVPATSD